MPCLRGFGLLDIDELGKAGPEMLKRVIGSGRVLEALVARLAEREASASVHDLCRREPALEAANTNHEPLVDTAATPTTAITEPAEEQDVVAVATEQSPPSDTANGTSDVAPEPQPKPPVALDLFIDVPGRRLTLWGVEISVRPPRNLPPQLFFGLASLALHVDAVVSEAELAEDMKCLGGLPRRPTSPDARMLRYRLVRALRSALGNHPNAAKIEGLIETVQGLGLRLNCTAQVVRARSESTK
jgi:hypothetical protein